MNKRIKTNITKIDRRVGWGSFFPLFAKVIKEKNNYAAFKGSIINFPFWESFAKKTKILPHPTPRPEEAVQRKHQITNQTN